MKDSKRTVLKQLLRGTIQGEEAAQELENAAGATTPVILVIERPDGLFDIGEQKGLTQEQVKAKTTGKPHVTVDEESALLGGNGPKLIAGDGVVFVLPDNGRGPNTPTHHL